MKKVVAFSLLKSITSSCWISTNLYLSAIPFLTTSLVISCKSSWIEEISGCSLNFGSSFNGISPTLLLLAGLSSVDLSFSKWSDFWDSVFNSIISFLLLCISSSIFSISFAKDSSKKEFVCFKLSFVGLKFSRSWILLSPFSFSCPFCSGGSLMYFCTDSFIFWLEFIWLFIFSLCFFLPFVLSLFFCLSLWALSFLFFNLRLFSSFSWIRSSVFSDELEKFSWLFIFILTKFTVPKLIFTELSPISFFWKLSLSSCLLFSLMLWYRFLSWFSICWVITLTNITIFFYALIYSK